MQTINPSTRRRFLASASCFGAAAAIARLIPLPALTEDIAQDIRVWPQPLVDKGFASVRKIGDGVYATISDFSKGTQTICNGGFLVGKDSALLIEGFSSPAGAGFQMETFRSLSQLSVQAALDTHYHFDHSLGNAHYGSLGIPLWAHAKVAPFFDEPPQDIESFSYCVADSSPCSLDLNSSADRRVELRQLGCAPFEHKSMDGPHQP